MKKKSIQGPIEKVSDIRLAHIDSFDRCPAVLGREFVRAHPLSVGASLVGSELHGEESRLGVVVLHQFPRDLALLLQEAELPLGRI